MPLQPGGRSVLRLATAGTTPVAHPAPQEAGELLERAERRWHGSLAQDGRRVDPVLDPAAAPLPVAGRTTGQILDVLLDNAHRHGRGTVTVSVRDIGAAVALDVMDEGTLTLDPRALFDRGTSTSTSTSVGVGFGEGIGLSLAAELAESAGARLSLTRTQLTRFTLLLPHSDQSVSREDPPDTP